MVYTDRFSQPKARPEVAAMRDAQLTFMKGLRELQLDVAVAEPRPPGLGAGRRR